MIKEITVQKLNTKIFIQEKVKEIKNIVGDGIAINALSGGVDSSTVTMLGHCALGNRIKVYRPFFIYFIKNRNSLNRY